MFNNDLKSMKREGAAVLGAFLLIMIYTLPYVSSEEYAQAIITFLGPIMLGLIGAAFGLDWYSRQLLPKKESDQGKLL